MKIQIHSSINNMSTTGRQVLGDMQDFSTPLIDLLVRESIQNSTDASKPLANDDDVVNVSYDVKSVPNANINGLFDQISDELDARYPLDEKSDCLVIRDSGTCGLTGYLRKRDVPVGEKWGNLIKLVYDIRKPQENSGAGGAWGLGKTVYYKLGIGIVLYYTRILQDGIYMSRLAACMVEDELDSQAILPVCPLKDDCRPSGIAWWGAADGDEFNKTIPITDETEIHDILQLFDVKPYGPTETGTTIIIPYLKTDKLLDVTRYTSADADGDTVINHQSAPTSKRTWMFNIPRFLSVAVQRWYYPRVDNKYYVEATGQRSLSISINGKVLKQSDMFPVFRLMQSLYNRSILDKRSADFEDFITSDSVKSYYEQKENCGKDDIKVNVNVRGKSGHLSYAKATPEILGMVPPYNFASPFLHFDIDEINEEGCAIVAYTRKPGMVVWYDVVRGLQNQSEYILGHFALQSDSIVVCANQQSVKNLEDYIRATEAANHRCWNGDDYNITQRIKKGVSNKILVAFRPAPIEMEKGPQDTGLGRLLGGFLPPTGFGNQASVKARRGTTSTTRLTSRKSRLRVDQVGPPEYSSQAVTLRYLVEVPANYNQSFDMELSVATEDKVISFNDLSTQMHMEPPFEITAVEVAAPEMFNIDLSNCHYIGNGIKVSLCDVNGVANKARFSVTSNESMNLSFSITLQYSSLEMKPVISVN